MNVRLKMYSNLGAIYAKGLCPTRLVIILVVLYLWHAGTALGNCLFPGWKPRPDVRQLFPCDSS